MRDGVLLPAAEVSLRGVVVTHVFRVWQRRIGQKVQDLGELYFRNSFVRVNQPAMMKLAICCKEVELVTGARILFYVGVLTFKS